MRFMVYCRIQRICVCVRYCLKLRRVSVKRYREGDVNLLLCIKEAELCWLGQYYGAEPFTQFKREHSEDSAMLYCSVLC